MPARRRAAARAEAPAASPRAAAAAVGGVPAPLRATAAVIVVAALGLVAAQAFLGEAAVLGRMVAAFESGGARVSPWTPTAAWDASFRDVDADARVPRPTLVRELAALLRPNKTRQYAIVVGECGTGKSTAVREAARLLPSPKGVVYFSAPELVASFSVELAAAVGYALPFDPLASVLSRLGGQASSSRSAGGTAWRELSDALQDAAARFSAKHGRPAVLVIDAADYVAEKDAAFFCDLQDFAKSCADAGALRVVFVSSAEGAALPLLRASSAWSRALPPYEVRDIDDALAVGYLVDRGMARGVAEEAVRTLTGGRFALLLRAAAAPSAESVAAMRRELDTRTSATLKGLGLAPAGDFFRELVAAGRVPEDAALDLVDSPALAALLRANVLAAHADGTYTVHARHVETFLRRAAAGTGREAL
jgi:hypothetical protein